MGSRLGDAHNAQREAMTHCRVELQILLHQVLFDVEVVGSGIELCAEIVIEVDVRVSVGRASHIPVVHDCTVTIPQNKAEIVGQEIKADFGGERGLVPDIEKDRISECTGGRVDLGSAEYVVIPMNVDIAVMSENDIDGRRGNSDWTKQILEYFGTRLGGHFEMEIVARLGGVNLEVLDLHQVSVCRGGKEKERAFNLLHAISNAQEVCLIDVAVDIKICEGTVLWFRGTKIWQRRDGTYRRHCCYYRFEQRFACNYLVGF